MLLIVLTFILLLLSWLLLSSLELRIDTRVPVIIIFRWQGLGKVTLLYEKEDWWLKMQVLFFEKKWNVVHMILSKTSENKAVRKKYKRKGKNHKGLTISRIFKLLESFRISESRFALSSDDETWNARWYWLNFFPLTRKYLEINFAGKNFLLLVIKNKVWRVVYAFIR